MTATDTDFAEALKGHQKRLGLSQRALADLVGFSPRLIWSWLQGEKTPREAIVRGVLVTLENTNHTDK